MSNTENAVEERRQDAATTSDTGKLKAYALDSEFVIRLAVVSRPDCPASVLGLLSVDPNALIRMKVAGHTNVPSSSLAALASDPIDNVRLHAVSNRSCPAEAVSAALMRELKAAPDPAALQLLMFLEEHDALDSDLTDQVRAATHGNADIEMVTLTLWHPNVHAVAVQAAAQSTNVQVRLEAAKSPKLSTSDAERLAMDDSVEVRRAVATNPHASTKAQYEASIRI